MTDLGLDDFVSAPDGVPMAAADVCNVESVTVDELRELLSDVAKRLGESKCENAWKQWRSGKPRWSDDDVRWTLTPQALRKLQQLV